MLQDRLAHLPFALILAALAALYLAGVQTIPNGSDHYFMIDVGETQIVLNLWGTLHATGYPLYVMTGAALTGALRAVGVDAAAAPALVSLLWGLLTLAALYVLAYRLTGRALLSALAVGLLGLTRTVWIHQLIAEIYTFGLLLTAILLLIALWPGPVRGRVYWLAFIGGIALAHHRAFITIIPALLYAAWPDLTAEPRRAPRMVLISLLLGLAGLLQYAYLPLRAWADAPWVYGEPGTFGGLWDQFIGTEAAQFIGPPASLADNLALVTGVLLTDLTAPGLLAGVIGLALAIRQPASRRPALTMAGMAAGAYGFHVVFYSDILSALILLITPALAFGWLWLADWALRRARSAQPAVVAVALACAAALIALHHDFIRDLTTDPTGLETIALADAAPPGATLMFDWGTRYFAAGFARDVAGGLPDVRLVDHKADFAALDGPLLTPHYTFYRRPVDWWAGQMGGPVYLRAAAPYLVEIGRAPVLDAPPATLSARAADLLCAPDALTLRVDWAAPVQIDGDWSVFVHLVDADGALLAQADQAHPVYGWRPTSTWEPGEIVRDYYPLSRLEAGRAVRYGLYQGLPDGTFAHIYSDERAITCEG